MQIKIVYDNHAREGFASGWGFSCQVENILFDTGDNPEDLLSNMTKLKIDPEDIGIVFISHHHHDHTGGLDGFLSQRQAKVMYPEDYSGPTQIKKDFYTTGTLKSFLGPVEHSLFIKTEKGIIVIVGCSHPGVDKILDITKKYGKIYAIIGGFHGFKKFDALEGIPFIAPCHCTQHMDEIKSRFPKEYREIMAGDTIELLMA